MLKPIDPLVIHKQTDLTRHAPAPEGADGNSPARPRVPLSRTRGECRVGVPLEPESRLSGTAEGCAAQPNKQDKHVSVVLLKQDSDLLISLPGTCSAQQSTKGESGAWRRTVPGYFHSSRFAGLPELVKGSSCCHVTVTPATSRAPFCLVSVPSLRPAVPARGTA